MQRRGFLLAASAALAGCGASEASSVSDVRGNKGAAPDYAGYVSNGLFSDQGDGWKVGGRQWRIRDEEIHHMQGACLDFAGPSQWTDVGIADGVYLHDAYIGLRTRDAGEYMTLARSFVSRCVFGALISSGNNRITDTNITLCSIGVKVAAGANNAHGIIDGCMVNHCTYPLIAQDVTLGQTFSACHFIAGQSGSDQGAIQINNSKGIAVSGGQISNCDIAVDGTSQFALRGVTLRGVVNLIVTAGALFDAKDSIVMAGAILTLNGQAWNGNT